MDTRIIGITEGDDFELFITHYNIGYNNDVKDARFLVEEYAGIHLQIDEFKEWLEDRMMDSHMFQSEIKFTSTLVDGPVQKTEELYVMKAKDFHSLIFMGCRGIMLRMSKQPEGSKGFNQNKEFLSKFSGMLTTLQDLSLGDPTFFNRLSLTISDNNIKNMKIF